MFVARNFIHRRLKQIKGIFTMKKIIPPMFAALATVAATPAMSASITLNDSFTVNATTSSSYYGDTHGRDMAGMRIIANYMDGTSSTYSLKGGYRSFSGYVSEPDFNLYIEYDSDISPWYLNISRAVDSIVFDGAYGDSVFDVTLPGGQSTPGSGEGPSFSSGSPAQMHATYSGAVKVNGAPAVGDLYRFLTLDFLSTSGYTGSFEFIADTDSLTMSKISTVPIPAPLALLAGGLIMLFGASKRNKKRASSQ